MNKRGIVLSGLVYALLTFFLLLVVGLLSILWYRQNTIDELSRDANAIYDDPYIPNEEYTAEFFYSGDYQVFNVPITGRYKIELWGANGGGAAGNGGYTSGEMYLDAADVLYVYVGEEGKTGSKGIAATAAVGKGAAETFNGGGAGGDAGGGSYPYENYRGGSSGGGATDIRLSKQNKYR